MRYLHDRAARAGAGAPFLVPIAPIAPIGRRVHARALRQFPFFSVPIVPIVPIGHGLPALRPPPLDQRPAVELAALGLGQAVAQHDLLRRAEGRHHRAAIVQDIVGADAGARPEHDVAHDLLAPDAVGHTDGGDLDHVGLLHEEAVDLERRDVDAAADDQLLLAPGEAEEPVGIDEAEVAGTDAAAAVDLE